MKSLQEELKNIKRKKKTVHYKKRETIMRSSQPTMSFLWIRGNIRSFFKFDFYSCFCYRRIEPTLMRNVLWLEERCIDSDDARTLFFFCIQRFPVWIYAIHRHRHIRQLFFSFNNNPVTVQFQHNICSFHRLSIYIVFPIKIRSDIVFLSSSPISINWECSSFMFWFPSIRRFGSESQYTQLF